MADTSGLVAKKRDQYLRIMQKAQQLNDQILVKLIIKKLVHLGVTNAVSTTSGCTIIPFPTLDYTFKSSEGERPGWWTLFKLTLAIPGSLVALILLAYYRCGPGVAG